MLIVAKFNKNEPFKGSLGDALKFKVSQLSVSKFQLVAMSPLR
jgi:hypothetical protein